MKSTNESNKVVPTNTHLKNLFWLYRLRKSQLMDTVSLTTDLQISYSLIGDMTGKALVQWCGKGIHLEARAHVLLVPNVLIFDV